MMAQEPPRYEFTPRELLIQKCLLVVTLGVLLFIWLIPGLVAGGIVFYLSWPFSKSLAWSVALFMFVVVESRIALVNLIGIEQSENLKLLEPALTALILSALVTIPAASLLKYLWFGPDIRFSELAQTIGGLLFIMLLFYEYIAKKQPTEESQ